MIYKWSFVLFTVLLILVIYYFSHDKPINVDIFVVKRGRVEKRISSTTTGIVKSKLEATISSQSQGRIERLYFDEGDRIKKGDIILEMEREEALTNLRLYYANLKEKKLKLKQLIMAKRIEEASFRNSINEARLRLDDARREYMRNRELFSKGIISKEVFDKTKLSYDLAKERYNLALVDEFKPKIKGKEIDITMSEIKEIEARIDLSKIELERKRIKAPFSGIISRLYVERGELLKIGSRICDIFDETHIEIEGTIDEMDSSLLKIGQKAKIKIEAYPGKLFTGKIIYISPVISTDKEEERVVKIKVRIDPFNSKELRIGLSADIEVIVDAKDNVLYIPTNAILEGSEGRYVYIIEKGIARKKKVDIGISNWDYSEVVRGVKEGDIIIKSLENKRLKQGVKVKIKK
jgi:HlyD family secretion protein